MFRFLSSSAECFLDMEEVAGAAPAGTTKHVCCSIKVMRFIGNKENSGAVPAAGTIQDYTMPRELVFSVTAKDCEWAYTRGTGNGGQKKNKTNSAVHCIHRPSGAHGYAEDTRVQAKNRSLAFARMAACKAFKDWSHREFLRRTGQQAMMEDNVNREMKKIRVDVKDDEGLWKSVDKDDPLDITEDK